MKFARSSALTLAVAYISLGLVALALFAAPLWYAWRVTIQEGRNEVLQSDAQRLTEVFRRDGPSGLVSYINARLDLQIAGERLLLLADGSLRPLAGNVAEWPSTVPPTAGSYSVKLELGGHLADVAVVHTVLPDGYHLLVGRDRARFQPLEQRFWYALARAVVILSVLGVIGGVLIRRALLARIEGIRRTVSTIIQGDLRHRLPTHEGSDELNTLSRTINGMLDQIELLINGVRNVSNSIAHDLRTPLAELRSRLEELALTRPPTERTFAEIDAAVADVDGVIRIFNALLRLAEIDSGMRRSGFVPVDLSAVAAAAVEFYQPAAELRGSSLTLASSGPAPMRGDPVLLAQALGNLIDNALKYTPEDGAIVVEVRTAAFESTVEIIVADSGPGIPEDQRPRAVERFYRGDASRGTPGVGLGLSLVDAVARLHGSELRLEDNHPGLRARIILTQDTPQITRVERVTSEQGGFQHEPVYP
jgi:signal transduction histidine kinase